jgi:hypothetical protein
MSEAVNSFHKLLDFIDQLKTNAIHYSLSSPTPRAIMIEVVVPGERWEIEFHEDGEVEIEVFRSLGVQKQEQLADLVRRFGE